MAIDTEKLQQSFEESFQSDNVMAWWEEYQKQIVGKLRPSMMVIHVTWIGSSLVGVMKFHLMVVMTGTYLLRSYIIVCRNVALK